MSGDRLDARAGTDRRPLVQERVEGDGDVEFAYAVLTLWGSGGRRAPREEATGFSVIEYDSADRMLMEHFGDCEPGQAPTSWAGRPARPIVDE